jgi:hypothetical protein
MNVKEIFDSALKDPTLLSTLDVDQLLESLENEKNDYLENKTINGINEENFNKIQEVVSDVEKRQIYCDKLIGYRLVDELHELHKGKHIRWIRNGTNNLTNGGIVVDIKFLDTGTHILCKNSMNRFIQYKFDDCITFQKLTEIEQLIIMAYESTN